MTFCNTCDSMPCICAKAALGSTISPWLVIPCQGCRFVAIRVRAGQQREGMRCKWCEKGIKLAGI